jgi:hypothetical protein
MYIAFSNSEEVELANVRCALSKARRELMVATDTVRAPGRLLRSPYQVLLPDWSNNVFS